MNVKESTKGKIVFMRVWILEKDCFFDKVQLWNVEYNLLVIIVMVYNNISSGLFHTIFSYRI